MKFTTRTRNRNSIGGVVYVAGAFSSWAIMGISIVVDPMDKGPTHIVFFGSQIFLGLVCFSVGIALMRIHIAWKTALVVAAPLLWIFLFLMLGLVLAMSGYMVK